MLDLSLGQPFKVISIKGTPTEFYLIGALAKALNRTPQTLRYWQELGVIPRGYSTNVSRTKDRRGRRRVFTREQIVGLVEIAAKEGLLDDKNKQVFRTEFPERAQELFEELKQHD